MIGKPEPAEDPSVTYRMPAEWEPQTATWLSWPHNRETWPDNLAAAQAEFVDLVRAIARDQEVNVMVGQTELPTAQKQLAGIDRVTTVNIATNDAWARDYAPTFVNRHDGQLAGVDWHYNAWGGKYPPYDLDQQVAKKVLCHLGASCVAPDLCFEGGAIDINEAGVLLTTRSCALDPNRNPGRTLPEIEALFQRFLGASNCIWLSGDAIAGDDTDGHIDQLARFANEQTIVYAWRDDPSDPQHRGLQQNLEDLQTGLSARGLDAIQRIPLPIPAPFEKFGRQIPASYCNFLITNGQVLVPQFGAPEDAQTLEILSPLFPDRNVIGLNSINLSVGLGSFHCLSQQEPRRR